MFNKVEPTSSSSPAFSTEKTQQNAAQASQPAAESSIESVSADSYSADASVVQQELKRLFLPMLAQVFQLGAAQHVSPTRLQHDPETEPEAARKKLLQLQKELEATALWTKVCLAQVKKALNENDEKPSSLVRWFKSLLKE